MQITLERRFFAINSLGDGESEFDWLLSMLNIPESEHFNIDTVELNMSAADVTVDDATVTVRS